MTHRTRTIPVSQACEHVIVRSDGPYMAAGTTAYYFDYCRVCYRVFHRERRCLAGLDPAAYDAARQKSDSGR